MTKNMSVEMVEEQTSNPSDIVFPVCCVRFRPGGTEPDIRGDIRGTAFNIANGYYLTALHVVNQKQPETEFAIGVRIESGLGACRVDHVEPFENHDVALLHVTPQPNDNPMPWSSKRLRIHSEVFTLGFAYAFNPQTRTLIDRGFQGYVVSCRNRAESPTAPCIYDLSFLCPRGLSGAPILKYVDGVACVSGMVWGNNITEMEVGRRTEREESEDGIHTTVHTTVEALHLGEALMAEEIASVESQRLGSSLGDYLSRIGLMR